MSSNTHGRGVVTLTANPSIDRTVVLDAPLARGEVQRAVTVIEQAAGKGMNVARVLATSGVDAIAVLPFTDDAYLARLAEQPANLTVAPVAGRRHRSRTNTAITEPSGTTTKVNEPGPTLSADDLDAAASALVEAADGAAWVALSGALPPGAPDDWYASLVASLAASGCKVAIDTSDADQIRPFWAAVLGYVEQEDYLVDPLHVTDAPDGEEVEAYLVGAYCIEDELILRRRIRFPYGVEPGDVIAIPNAAGYFMHILESASHQIPLAKNVVYPGALDDIDR